MGRSENQIWGLLKLVAILFVGYVLYQAYNFLNDVYNFINNNLLLVVVIAAIIVFFAHRKGWFTWIWEEIRGRLP